MEERGPLWRGGPDPVGLPAPGETMNSLEGVLAFHTQVGVSATLPSCYGGDIKAGVAGNAQEQYVVKRVIQDKSREAGGEGEGV